MSESSVRFNSLLNSPVLYALAALVFQHVRFVPILVSCVAYKIACTCSNSHVQIICRQCWKRFLMKTIHQTQAPSAGGLVSEVRIKPIPGQNVKQLFNQVPFVIRTKSSYRHPYVPVNFMLKRGRVYVNYVALIACFWMKSVMDDYVPGTVH